MELSSTRLFVAIAACASALFGPGCGKDLTEHTNVHYDDRFGDSTIMDVYAPDDVGEHPAVLLIHGGSWSGGSKAEFTQAAQRLAHSGYVAATINYRLVPDGVFPRAVQDCLCALSYFRAHATDYHFDPKRVAVWGYSAGGHLASLVGVAADDPTLAPDCAAGPTSAPAAVVSGAGIDDFRGLGDIGAIHDFMGGSESDLPDAYQHASPITHVAAGKPPFLFVSGSADLIVDPKYSIAMKDALLGHGNDATLIEIAGGGHLINPSTDFDSYGEESDHTPEAWVAIEAFLARTIGSAK
jgi:acetyl esterase/lipase